MEKKEKCTREWHGFTGTAVFFFFSFLYNLTRDVYISPFLFIKEERARPLKENQSALCATKVSLITDKRKP